MYSTTIDFAKKYTGVTHLFDHTSPYSTGDIVVLRFKPGTEDAIIESLHQSNPNSIAIVELQGCFLPAVQRAEQGLHKNIIALFPSEWSEFHELMEAYSEEPAGVLYLLDNSLAAENYADDVIVVKEKATKYNQSDIQNDLPLVLIGALA